MSKIEQSIKKGNYRIETFILLLYISALIIIMYYHEPWFDEAQAWLIARDATPIELLSSITHYEGHPPIWHFILMPFAKSGVPYEIGLKTVNLTLVTLAMGIFIYKAPFNRLIRCTIPFTYFFFYQYGVISRTYSLMMLGFVLSALTYRKRNENPFRFIAALSLICGASAYGILIAAGISLVWLWELVAKPFSLEAICTANPAKIERGSMPPRFLLNKIKLFLKSKSFYALLILLIFNILLLLCIYPYPDTSAAMDVVKRPKIEMLLYMLFIAPADATCSFGYIGSEFQIISSVIISVIIYITMLKVTGMFQKRALFIVPYLLFALCGGMLYFSMHHIGIITMFYMFLLWCCFDERAKAPEASRITPQKHLYYIGNLLVLAIIGISIFWSISASIKEINLNYGTGYETAEFIKNNKLERKNILVAWREIVNSDKCFTNYNCVLGVAELSYFNKNIFYNFNNKLDNKCYLTHIVNTNGSYTDKLIRNDYPDILIGSGDSTFTFGSEINMDDFILVKSIHGNTIWKSKTVENSQFIYMRKDLLKNYPKLTPLN